MLLEVMMVEVVMMTQRGVEVDLHRSSADDRDTVFKLGHKSLDISPFIVPCVKTGM